MQWRLVGGSKLGEALWRTENASLLFLSLLVTYFIISNYLLGPRIPDPER